MRLSDVAVRKAKPQEKPYKLSDGGGLYVFVQLTGAKLWRLKYRFGSKEKLLSFGPYPAISLASARRKRDEARQLLAEGTDPSAQKKLDKIAAATSAKNSFGAIADELLANKEASEAAGATMDKNRWLLKDLAEPLANRPITEITAAEILQLLKRIEASGRRETARRLRGAIGSVFRYAIVTLRATSDPTIALHGALLAPKVQHRAAILDEKQLGGLMRAIDDYDGWPTVAAALKFTALTFARPGEVRGATRKEIDLENAVWRISAERTKMRRPHEARMLRGKLLLYRFHRRFDIKPDPALADPRLEPRFNQVLMPLLSLAKEEGLREGMRHLAAEAQTALAAERGLLPEAQVLEVLAELMGEEGRSNIPVGEVAARFADRHGRDHGRPVTNRWIGGILRRRLNLQTYKSHGVFVVPAVERGKVAGFCARYGVEFPGPLQHAPGDMGTSGTTRQSETA